MSDAAAPLIVIMVRVLWVCNAWVDAWYAALQPDLQRLVHQERDAPFSRTTTPSPSST